MSLPSLVDLVSFANESTRDRRRAEAMGFVFGPARVECTDYGGLDGHVVLRGAFSCVCGQLEAYQFVATQYELEQATTALLRDMFDPALRLRHFGSFSREHLLEDGYSEAQVDEILRRGDEFDKEHPV